MTATETGSAARTAAAPRPAGYSAEDLALDLRWWAAANYLTAAQIYLRANPLLREPLRREHIKARLLGHWGTSPGLTMLHALLNRLIRRTASEVLFVTGPGHGGPAVLAGAYLDGTYSEVHPEVSQDQSGLSRLVRQFSTPGGVSSHAGVHIPGSIHEGGELGYALLHAAGAAFDDPELLVACVIGDGEAETGPLAASWRLPAFLNGATAPSCRSCTSTATRSRDRPCSAGPPTTTSAPSWAVRAGHLRWSPGTTRSRCSGTSTPP
jgi:xylulose-5-phosphate/fructose-6-phosphate phosphoketolase